MHRITAVLFSLSSLVALAACNNANPAEVRHAGHHLSHRRDVVRDVSANRAGNRRGHADGPATAGLPWGSQLHRHRAAERGVPVADLQAGLLGQYRGNQQHRSHGARAVCHDPDVSRCHTRRERQGDGDIPHGRMAGFAHALQRANPANRDHHLHRGEPGRMWEPEVRTRELTTRLTTRLTTHLTTRVVRGRLIVALLAAGLASGACYRYVPVPIASVPNAEVRIAITPAAAQRLATDLGCFPPRSTAGWRPRTVTRCPSIFRSTVNTGEW